MSTMKKPTYSVTQSGTFWCGLGIIMATVLLNLGYDRLVAGRLNGDGSEVLPSFLGTLYESIGKGGVTLIFVGLGVAVILGGYVAHELRGLKGKRPVPLYTPRSDAPIEGANGVPSQPGQLALQTRKYLR